MNTFCCCTRIDRFWMLNLSESFCALLAREYTLQGSRQLGCGESFDQNRIGTGGQCFPPLVDAADQHNAATVGRLGSDLIQERPGRLAERLSVQEYQVWIVAHHDLQR
jgi:hypothetical protein